MSIEIIPAIMPDTFDDLRTKLALVQGATRNVQIDVMDGIFVLGKTWPYSGRGKELFSDIVRGNQGFPFWEDFDFEADFMVDRPELVIADWVRAGIARAIIHIESRHDFSACLRATGDAVDVGVAINTTTPLSRLDTYIGAAAFVQFMGIATIGRQGELFDERVLAHISSFKQAHPDVTIQVDGGVSAETIPLLKSVGVTRFAVGSAILRAEDPKQMIRELKHIA